MGILTLENVTLELDGEKILDGLSIDFWAGHIHAIIGPNGAGKSTMASVIMGLQGYTDIDGDIRFDGQSIRDMGIDERARLGITMAWQEPVRFEGLKVRDYLRAGAEDRSEDALEAALDAVGLPPGRYLDRACDKTLSGGERKRIELASILVMRPRLVLMDEPDSGIDVEALEKIFEALRLFRDQDATVILITHSLAVLEQAEHAFLLCDGQLVDKGAVEHIARYFEGKCLSCDSMDPIQIGELQ